SSYFAGSSSSRLPTTSLSIFKADGRPPPSMSAMPQGSAVFRADSTSASPRLAVRTQPLGPVASLLTAPVLLVQATSPLPGPMRVAGSAPLPRAAPDRGPSLQSSPTASAPSRSAQRCYSTGSLQVPPHIQTAAQPQVARYYSG
ncbi:unnamed protein product, partial [Polarella glacialis]